MIVRVIQNFELPGTSMRFLLSVVLGSVLSLSATYVRADQSLFSDPYFKAEFGQSLSHDTGNMEFLVQSPNLVILDDNDIGNAFTGGLGIGAKISDSFRGELLINHRRGYRLQKDPPSLPNTLFDASISSSSLMVGGFYDITTIKLAGVGITPNLSGAIGVALNRISETEFYLNSVREEISGNRNYDLAWSLGSGVGINLSDLIDLDVTYRYVNLGSFKSGSLYNVASSSSDLIKRFEADIIAHEFLVGVRYKF